MNMQDETLHGNVNIDFSKKHIKRNTQKTKKINTTANVEEPIFDVKKRQLPVRVVALGGLEQVGENMMFIEYLNDIIVVDAGMLMPGGEIYGVDYIIPDYSYLKQKKQNVRGIIITHGHLDHIGALKHVLPDLDYPTVYGSPLAIGLIKKSLEGTEHLTKFKSQIVNPDVDIIKLGVFSIEFFRVNHSIPEPMGLAINTPKGLIVHTGDFKIDFTPAIDKVADIAKIARIGQEGVKLLFADSTNAIQPGRTPSEKQIGQALEDIIKTADSRLIIATFSTLIGRISQIIEYATRYGKIVFLSGRSMVNNVEIAKQLGYINPPPGVVRKLNDDVDSLPDSKVIILTTGSQGEEFSALVRIAQGEHPQIKIRPGDKVLLSAVPIPGNEMAVVDMINKLIRNGADVITNKDLDLHVSGHGYQEDLKMMLSLVKPKYFVPVHGELYQRYAHKKIAMELGMDSENVFLVDNGQIIEVYDSEVKISPKKLKLDTVMIDGLGIGHLSGEYVMKARQIMSESGIVTLIFKVDSKTKELVGNIQIESRGFVYSSEVKKVHTNIVDFSRKKYYELFKKGIETKEIMRQIKEELSDQVMKITGRVPMIIPMFVYINRDNAGHILDETPEEQSLVGMTLEEQGVEE